MKRIPRRIVWHNVVRDVTCYNVSNGFVDIEEWQTFNKFKCVGFAGKRASLKFLNDGFTDVCIIVSKMFVPP
ncbi:MAG: hypothetical protein EA420_01645 [Candidatus Competibacteraceae bacterium]|nr:MAG: hypothetical protein EA420_01645 [Candidatus Competibacteraceae bacterium]